VGECMPGSVADDPYHLWALRRLHIQQHRKFAVSAHASGGMRDALVLFGQDPQKRRDWEVSGSMWMKPSMLGNPGGSEWFDDYVFGLSQREPAPDQDWWVTDRVAPGLLEA